MTTRKAKGGVRNSMGREADLFATLLTMKRISLTMKAMNSFGQNDGFEDAVRKLRG